MVLFKLKRVGLVFKADGNLHSNMVLFKCESLTTFPYAK